MMLFELAPAYRDSAAAIHLRICQLRDQAQSTADAEARRVLERRISVLLPLLIETRELAQLTARYYERGFRRNGKYTL
jgi:hypothetical protein